MHLQASLQLPLSRYDWFLSARLLRLLNEVFDM